MNSHWTIAALLSLALSAGCSGRNTENSQNPDQNPAQATGDQTVETASPAQAPEPYAAADNAGTRTPPTTSSAARSETAPRTSTASRNETSRYAPGVRTPSAESSRAPEGIAPAPRGPEWHEVTIPTGTALPLEMTTALSSASAQVETPVSARLRSALAVDGETVIPAGAVVTGTVTDVERSGRVQGVAHLSLAFNEIRLNSGRENLRTNPVTFEAEATKGEDATKVGVGAVGGAILGGILGGKKGAGKGAVAGGAAGTGVVLATRGKEVSVTEGMAVTATLAQPLTLRIPVR